LLRKWRTYFAVAMIFILLFHIPFMSQAYNTDEIHPPTNDHTNICETMNKLPEVSMSGSQMEEMDCEEVKEQMTANDPVAVQSSEDTQQQPPPTMNEGEDAEKSGDEQDGEDSEEPVEKKTESHPSDAEQQEETTEENEKQDKDVQDAPEQPDTMEENQDQETDQSMMTDEQAEKERSEDQRQRMETADNDSEKEFEDNDEADGKRQTKTLQSVELSGLAGVNLLNNTSLEAEQTSLANGMERITLTYSGRGLLNLDLLANSHTIFRLPPEMMDRISPENISATYDVPGLLGIIRNRGEFSPEQIHLDRSLNQVSMDFFNLLSLSILASYTFTLSIDLEELPPTESGEYAFLANARSQLVDLSLLSADDLATATLTASTLPGPPVIHEPVYTTDTHVTGTGEPDTTIVIQIDDNAYEDQVNAEGNFSVDTEGHELEAGTVIRGMIINSEGIESDEKSVIVVERPPPPIPDDVYSNDTMVTGSGKPNATVALTIHDTTYHGDVDERGDFSIGIPAQVPGTVISAVQITEDGYVSETVDVTVIEASLSFYHVPESLSFAATVIEPGEVRVPRQNPGWSLQVRDTRGPGSAFRVYAEAEQPLTSVNGSHTLPEALVYVDEYGDSYALDDGFVEVYAGRTEVERMTTIHWSPDQGPMVEVDPGDAYVGAYETTITWTLVDAP